MTSIIPKIYVVHYKKLEIRKTNLTKQFAQNGITNYEFYDKFDRRGVTKDDLDPYFVNPFNSHFEVIVKCITLSHYNIYKEVSNSDIPYVLILEDDAVLIDDFANKLKKYLDELPADFDMAFINAGCGMHIPKKDIKPNQIWYESKGTRTCCAYLISNKCCKILTDNMIPIKCGIDIELNKHIIDNNLKVYWCEPNIVRDGSEFCYKSTRDEEIVLK